MVNFLNKNPCFQMNNLISELEYLMIYTTLFYIDNFIQQNIYKNYKVFDIFLDVQKVFDRVTHDTLFKKISQV